jgi:hypothetical protein
MLRRSQRAEHGYRPPATGSPTGGYGRGSRRVCCTAGLSRPSSDERCRGACHGSFAWAPDGGGLLRQRALDAWVPTPHPRHPHPRSGGSQPGDHRLSADGVHRHVRHLRPLAEALTRRFPQLLDAKQPHADPRVNPGGLLKDSLGEPPWNLLPDPESLEEGIRGGASIVSLGSACAMARRGVSWLPWWWYPRIG